MIQYQPQPVYTLHPGHILNAQNMGNQAQTQDTYDLEALAHSPTPTHQYFEVESGQDELAVWRRDAHGPRRASENAPQPILQAFNPSPAPTYNAAFDPRYHSVMSQSQQLTQAQAQNQHYYQGSSSANSPPSQGYSYHSQAPYQQSGNYPSSISSNDRHMTQEEADLKRLRNTAASARFRAKKKRREQSLERSSREKKERLQALEGRIRDLEAENQWLKDLIMEKNDVRTDAERVHARYARAANDTVEDDRKGYERKDGVGT